MSIKNKNIVRRYIETILNTGNTNHISAFISEDYVEIQDGKKYKMGIQGAIDHVVGVRNTYPDIQLKIDQQFSDGDYVITCYTMSGTHTGDWMGIKPTNKKITVTGVNVNRIKEGKIVEHGGAANLLMPLLDIKAIKINQ